MPSFADLKRQMRRDVHAAFAVLATYEDPFTNRTAVTVRWHDRSVRGVGDINDYPAVLEAVDKLIFDSEEISELGLTLARNGVIRLAEYGDYELILDTQDPPDGPIKILWTVRRPKQAVEL